ncbi:peptidylprolyl isomerase [Verrucomicrobia bacterium LW23]|nr:peptidylprolyl isomerase [Verrucomicrobia bacterium LW23]
MILRLPLLQAARGRGPALVAVLAACLMTFASFFIATVTASAQTLPEGFLTPREKEKLVKTSSGLQYVDVVEGKGNPPLKGQTVTVHYTGWLTNGQMFDSSLARGKPYTYFHRVSQQIVGWSEGVSTMKPGGKRKLIIPPRLGYGSDGSGSIPPNATLLFEIELISAEGETMK